MLRSGLREGNLPFTPSERINSSPYGEIPVEVYNGLPLQLRAVIGGPLEDALTPVPIAPYGRATILRIGG